MLCSVGYADVWSRPMSCGVMEMLSAVGNSHVCFDVFRLFLKQLHCHAKSDCVGQVRAVHPTLVGGQLLRVLRRLQGSCLWKGSGQETTNLAMSLPSLRPVVCVTGC